MTKEESIAFAEKLQKDYANLDALKDQVKRNTAEIKSRSEHKVKGHSFFKYYWPWLLVALGLFILIRTIHRLMFSYSVDSVQYALINLRYFAPIIALVVGAVIAGVKKGNNANEVALAEQSVADTINKLEKANADNKSKINRIETELQEYSSMVPIKARSKTAMFKVVSMLKTGKAEDFEDAVSKLQ